MVKYQESEEMYLETILLLKKRSSRVHSIDIANELEYSRPSVSRAVNLLQKKGYISIDTNGAISFTELGEAKAEAVYERHTVLTELFVKMGADKNIAEEDACRIEHVVSDEMFGVIKNYLKKM